MVDFTIPPEAVEAAIRAYPKLTRDEAMWIVGCALKAWPGMFRDYWNGDFSIILPLPPAERRLS